MQCTIIAGVCVIATLVPTLAADSTAETSSIQFSITATNNPFQGVSSLPTVQFSGDAVTNLTTDNVTTNPTGSLAPSPSSPVSWQSALWGLIALSLNAQTQRSAADHFPSSDSLSPARSSPFICLADIIVAVIWLLRGWKAGMGLRGALKWYRKETGLIREKGDRELIQGIPAVTVAFFVLGPLPQALKLFGAKGLTWSKACAAIFFTAWMVEVVLRFFAGMKHDVSWDTRDLEVKQVARHLRQISKFIYQMAFTAQIVIWLWILIVMALTPDLALILGAMVLLCVWGLGIAIAIQITIAIVLLSVTSLFSHARSQRVYLVLCAVFLAIISFVWVKFVFMSTWFYEVVNWLGSNGRPVGFIFAIFMIPLTGLSFVWACVAILVSVDTLLVSVQQERQHEQQNRIEAHSLDTPLPPSRTATRVSVSTGWLHRMTAFSNWLESMTSGMTFHYKNLSLGERRRVQAIAFSLANLFFTTLWYCFKYDADGTAKPAWTEMLG